MTKPLAVVCYESLLPGSQLLNRLQDLGYRVHAVNDLDQLVGVAREQQAIVVLIDLTWRSRDVCVSIRELRQNAGTSHIPMIAFATGKNHTLQAAAREAGATLVTNDAAMLTQLPQLLEQALEV